MGGGYIRIPPEPENGRTATVAARMGWVVIPRFGP